MKKLLMVAAQYMRRAVRRRIHSRDTVKTPTRFVFLACILVFLSCEATNEPSIVTEVIVAPEAHTINALGDSVRLTAEARDANGDPIPNKMFAWSSSSESIVMVSSSGMVTAVGNGRASINATTDGVSGSALITVDQVPASVAISRTDVTFRWIGSFATLTAEALDSAGNPLANATFIWSSSAPSVATVDSVGRVTAMSEGVSTITAATEGVSGSANIIVAIYKATIITRTEGLDASEGFDGWAVTHLGESRFSMGANDTSVISLAVFSILRETPVDVYLRNVPSDCSLPGTVHKISAYADTTLFFDISCNIPVDYRVTIITKTDGPDAPENFEGLATTHLAESRFSTGANDTSVVLLREFDILRGFPVEIRLTNVPANCDGPLVQNISTFADTTMFIDVRCHLRLLPGEYAVSPNGSTVFLNSQRDRLFDPAARTEIYSVSIDGSGLTNLSQSPTSNDQFIRGGLSSDGSKILFESDRRGCLFAVCSDIFVLTVSDKSIIQITNRDEGDFGPAWSPDGSKIAFLCRYDGNQELCVVDSDGANLTRLTFSALLRVRRVDGWSPDGTKILYQAASGVANQDISIWVAESDGSGVVALSSEKGDLDPMFSPAGDRIAFVTVDPDFEIAVMDADGTMRANISQSPETIDNAPVWSPDGTQISFIKSGTTTGAPNVVWLMQRDGSLQIPLTSPSDSFPDVWGPAFWFPSGSELLISQIVENRIGFREVALFKIDSDGKNLKRVSQ